MLARFYIAPVTLFVLQVAPVGVKVDDTGRLRLAFGGALGSYQETSTDCDGNVLDRQNFKFHTVGGEAEAYVAPKVRVAAHAGNMSTTPGTSEQGAQLAPPFQGFFGGALIAYEGEKSGGGVGVAREPLPSSGVPDASSGKVIPMLYLRFGRLEKVHFFIESGGPAAPGGPPERGRVGIGSGWGQRRQVGVRASIGGSSFPNGSEPDFALLVRLPVARSLDIGFSGTFLVPNGGNIGVFGRASWGSLPR